MKRLDGNQPVEELVQEHPEVVGWLARRGIVCIECGEPYWGPLVDLANEKGLSGEEFQSLLDQLSRFIAEGTSE